MVKTALVWFKTDLRIEDNETLVKAISQSQNLLAVYCFDESHFETTNYGFKKTGNFRTQFLMEALEDLDSNLRKIGSGLLIVKGNLKLNLQKSYKNIKYKKFLQNEK